MPSAFLLRDTRHAMHDIFFCASLQVCTPFRPAQKQPAFYSRQQNNKYDMLDVLYLQVHT